MLTSEDYKQAIRVQDACNLSGVVHSWSKMISKIWEEAHAGKKGTEWVNTHPINVMFASKIASLTGCETPETFSKAYAACQDRAGGE